MTAGETDEIARPSHDRTQDDEQATMDVTAPQAKAERESVPQSGNAVPSTEPNAIDELFGPGQDADVFAQLGDDTSRHALHAPQEETSAQAPAAPATAPPSVTTDSPQEEPDFATLLCPVEEEELAQDVAQYVAQEEDTLGEPNFAALIGAGQKEVPGEDLKEEPDFAALIGLGMDVGQVDVTQDVHEPPEGVVGEMGFATKEEPDFSALIGAGQRETAQEQPEKDYSALLAEFEAGGEFLPDDLAPEAAGPSSDFSAAEGDKSAAAFFGDDPSPFDSLAPGESPDPNICIENTQHAGDVSVQSLFSNASDWIADTTVDDSFQIEPVASEGQEPVAFDVPQGWYNENGEFQYYTEEEREAVRLAMLGEADPGLGQDLSSTPLEMQSENHARRTPQQEQGTTLPLSTYDPYTAPPVSSSTYLPNPYARPPPIAGYCSSPAAPNASLYDPYTPASQPVSPYASAYPSAGPAAPPTQPKAPPKPQRIVSNAYDPPLRPQKSFIRPPSAVPAVSPFTSPNPSVPPQVAPAPPPPGPPRRAQTERSTVPPPPPREGAASVGPSFAPPIPSIAAQLEDDVEQRTHPVQGYGASSQPVAFAPPTQPLTQPPIQPRPPARQPVHNSFDPPLRPTSEARSVSRATSRLQFSPPSEPVLSPTKAEPTLLPPPRGPPRKASPAPRFAPPPSKTLAVSQKEDVPRAIRMESPLAVPSFEVREEEDLRSGKSEQSHHTGPPAPPRRLNEDQADLEGEGDDWRNQLQHEASEPAHSTHEPSARTSYESQSEARRSIETPTRLSFEMPTRSSSEDLYRPSVPEAAPRAEPQPIDSYRPYQPYQPTPAASTYDPYQPIAPNTQSAPAQSRAPEFVPSSLGLHSMSPMKSPYDAFATRETQDPYQSTTQSQRSHNAISQSSASYQPFVPAAPIPNPVPVPLNRAPSPAHGSELGVSPAANYFQAHYDDTYVPQQVLEQKPVSEDPLGRCTLAARNTPLAIFGFGGLLVTAFPAMAEDPLPSGHGRKPSYGYASGRGQLWIRSVSEVAAPSALKADLSFPGPLLDSPKGTGKDKKKETVVTYLEARADEIEKGLPYLKSSSNAARREQEGKLVLVRLLAAMLLGEGKFSGNPKVEDALRAAFESPSEPSLSPTATSAAMGFHSKSTAATPAQLAQLSEMMLGGNMRGAVEFAANHSLWSHALVISSCVDQELWKDVVLRFSVAELAGRPKTAALRASYAVASGKTTESVDDLIAAADVANSSDWREVLSTVVFNSNAAQLNCLDELGQKFHSLGLVYAAHGCFLLSPSSPFGDVSPASYDKPIMLTQDPRDEDAIIFAEIAEYARSLIPVPKGQEVPFGLPQLVPYKLQRAWRAAEFGDINQAQRYCAAVEAALNHSKQPHPGLVASLEDLLERLTGTPSINPVKGLARKPAKPGFDKLGSWIEGRLTKFIAGEEGDSAPSRPAPATNDAIGPFSHFSSISPQVGLSRNPSSLDVPELNGLHLSPKMHSPVRQLALLPHGHRQEATDDSSTSLGDFLHARESSYTPWSVIQEAPQEENNNEAESGEFIHPMVPPAFGAPGAAAAAPDYAPRATLQVEEPDEDLGFGNTSLSRGRTPRPADTAGEGEAQNGATVKDEPKPEAAASPSKMEPQKSSGWLRGWWGKKEGEGSGPIKAKLGEESSMVYDKELKRWVVKGAKGESSLPAPPPPPPRAQTASPSRTFRQEQASRAMSATPPPSQLSRSTGPPSLQFSSMSRSTTAPLAFAEANGGIKRMKSGLSESVSSAPSSTIPPSNAQFSPNSSPPSAPRSGPPSTGRPPTSASLDDLLSRPPPRRPASAAKKGARNRYVDVFQPGAEGG